MEYLEVKVKRKRSLILTVSLIVGVVLNYFECSRRLIQNGLSYREHAFKSRMGTRELFKKGDKHEGMAKHKSYSWSF